MIGRTHFRSTIVFYAPDVVSVAGRRSPCTPATRRPTTMDGMGGEDLRAEDETRLQGEAQEATQMTGRCTWDAPISAPAVMFSAPINRTAPTHGAAYEDEVDVSNKHAGNFASTKKRG